MKKSELLKFIEDEVGQIVKSEKSKKPDLKKEAKKDIGLQEVDFDDTMFQKLDESKKLNKMKKINLEELKKLINETLEVEKAIPQDFELDVQDGELEVEKEDEPFAFDKEKMPNLSDALMFLKKYYIIYPKLYFEKKNYKHTSKGEELSDVLEKIENLVKKALDIVEPIKTKEQ